jgi:5-methylcytosine-specific restriction endonuclease McrA
MSSDLHAQLRTARRAHQRAEHDLALLLFELKTTRRYTERGHASVESYAEAELDLTSRQTRDLVAIAKHLRDLPALAKAFSDGRLSATKAREVVRVATAETDAAWTERACETTSRVLERQVAAARRGEAPPDDPAALPANPRLTLRFDVSAADAEVIRATLARLRLQGGFGPDADDGALLADIARSVLHAMEQGPAAAGAPPTAERYRVSIHHCPDCEKTHVGDPQAPQAVEHTDRDCAECDAEVLDLTATAARLSHAIPPATRRKVFEIHDHRCAVPYCRNRMWLDLHHIRPRSAGGDHKAVNLLPLCSAHHRLIHEGGLVLIVEPATGRPRFVLPTGENIAARRRDSESVEQTAARVERALDEAPGTSGRGLIRVIEPENPGLAAATLSTLRAIGRAVVTVDDQWFGAGVVMGGV